MQLYTGNHWRVPADLLAEVQHYSKFAVREPLHTCTTLCFS